jgi:hypothetical protein
MSTLTAVIILIIIIIIAIWFTHHLYSTGGLPEGAFRDTFEGFVNTANYKYDEYFTPPHDLYKKTVGYKLDDNAKLALSKAKKKDDMYTTNETSGTMSKSKAGDATDNSFILANLLNFNVAENEPDKKSKKKAKAKSAQYFNKTLDRIVAEPAAVVQTVVQPVEFMVDRAEDFYEDYVIQVNAENPAIVRELYIPNFEQIRNTVRNTRTEQVKKQAKEKQLKMKNLPAKTIEQELYYMPKDIPSDPQNVHDSNVVSNVKMIYDKVISKNSQEKKQSNDESVLNEIRHAIDNFPFTGGKGTAAKNTFDVMIKNKLPTAFEATEKDVLVDVWRRITSAENETRRTALKESFMDSLAESNGNNVCTMGRCSRVLSSLTLLDKDTEISKPIKTVEILRNEALMKAHKVVLKVLNEIPKDVSDAYQDPEKLLGANADTRKKVDELETTIKNEIESTLKKDYPDVPAKKLNEIIKDAQAGV